MNLACFQVTGNPFNGSNRASRRALNGKGPTHSRVHRAAWNRNENFSWPRAIVPSNDISPRSLVSTAATNIRLPVTPSRNMVEIGAM